MDRRTILAITLCFLIYLGWHKLYLEPRMTPPTTSEASSTTNTASQSTPSTLGAVPTIPTAKVAAETLPLEVETGKVLLTNEASFFQNWILKGYKVGMGKDDAAVDLKTVTHDSGEVQLAFDDTQLAYLNDVRGVLKTTPQGALWSYEDSNVKLTREFIGSPQSTYLDTKLSAEFKTRSPRFAFVSLASRGFDQDPEAQDRQLLYWHEGVERINLKDNLEQKQVASPVKYIAATNRYFILTVVDGSPVSPNGLLQSMGPHAGRMSMVYPITSNSIQIPLKIYFGPKELSLLRKIEPTLDHAVDFGWFTVCAYPILQVLKWLYGFVQNYGLSIILLTLLLKLLTFPLNYKSMKNMKNMAKLQPQLQKIREKYKDDKESLNREMLTLMKDHGYNPAAGCLPVLIQMPIFFALYRVLYSSIELYHAPFGFWIHDLSSRDPFYITPVLLSLTMFVQQKLTPNTATDPAQAKMMQLMPLIFGAFMLTLPSGLTLYMLVNAIASIAQQMFLNKKLDIQPAAKK